MRCDSEGRFPNCVGVAVVMYPMGEATSFHCYPCHREIEDSPPGDLDVNPDGSRIEAVVMSDEQDRYDRQRRFYEANPGNLR